MISRHLFQPQWFCVILEELWKSLRRFCQVWQRVTCLLAFSSILLPKPWKDKIVYVYSYQGDLLSAANAFTAKTCWGKWKTLLAFCSWVLREQRTTHVVLCEELNLIAVREYWIWAWSLSERKWSNTLRIMNSSLRKRNANHQLPSYLVTLCSWVMIALKNFPFFKELYLLLYIVCWNLRRTFYI